MKRGNSSLGTEGANCHPALVDDRLADGDWVGQPFAVRPPLLAASLYPSFTLLRRRVRSWKRGAENAETVGAGSAPPRKADFFFRHADPPIFLSHLSSLISCRRIIFSYIFTPLGSLSELRCVWKTKFHMQKVCNRVYFLATLRICVFKYLITFVNSGRAPNCTRFFATIRTFGWNSKNSAD